MNEHDESAPRARNTRKSRALKRPSRWLEKRTGAVSSRPTAVPGEPDRPPRPALAPASAPVVVPVTSAAAFPVVAAPPTRSGEASFDDHAADFFREGENAPAMATLELDDDRAHAAVDGRPDAVALVAEARRRAFSRHVLGVVALSVVVCIAAFVRSATGAPPPSAATATTAATTPQTTNAPTATAPATLAPATLAPTTPAPTTPAPTTTAQTTPSAPSMPVAADVARAAAEPATPAAPSVEASPVAARVAREDARRALDRGAAAAAISAGAQSVELDPTDAEAWLILGAAYQLAGKGTEARSAFYSCSKLAKRGSVGECRALVP